MRTFLFGMLVLTASPFTPAAGQRGSEASLVLTILGGTVTGHSLWSVAKQPLCVGASSCTSQYDTLRVSRSIGSSLVLGAAGTYFPTEHLGVHLEISYMGLPQDSDCTPLFLNPDTENKNEQICADIKSQSAGGGSITIFGGVTLRAAPRRSFSPYVRGNVGIVNQSHSTVEVVGAYVDAGGSFFERQVVVDPKPHRNSFLIGAAAGFTSPLGSGYQFRFEIRDLITSLNRLTGPANAIGVAPMATRSYHHFALTLGFDVVLEKSRGRRY